MTELRSYSHPNTKIFGMTTKIIPLKILRFQLHSYLQFLPPKERVLANAEWLLENTMTGELGWGISAHGVKVVTPPYLPPGEIYVFGAPKFIGRFPNVSMGCKVQK